MREEKKKEKEEEKKLGKLKLKEIKNLYIFIQSDLFLVFPRIWE